VSVASDARDGNVRAASIARASAEYVEQRDAWRTHRRIHEERRRTLRAVDDFLTTVEEINLAGRGRQPDPLIPHRLRRLETEIGSPVPAPVRIAGTGHRLHEALMQWEEDLLDELHPSRAAQRVADEASIESNPFAPDAERQWSA
jgi:hypothetical protein